jgi:hypothetical protein
MGAQTVAQAYLDQSSLLTEYDLMLKYAEVRFRGKEVRVADQPSFVAFGSGPNSELDWWFAE